MLNSRVVNEKGCKLQKNKWVGRAVNKSLWCHNPQRHQTGGLAQREPWSSLWVLKWTPAVTLVRRPTDYFPESLEVSAWHWTFPGFWEALTKCAKYRYLLTTFTFLHPGPKFLIWFWTKGQKEKSQDLFSWPRPRSFPSRLPTPIFSWKLQTKATLFVFKCVLVMWKPVSFCCKSGIRNLFFASFRTLSWQNQSHEKEVETS